LDSGFYKRGHQRRESILPKELQGHWPLFISDHQVEWADICGYLKNKKRGMFCKYGNLANSNGSGDLVNDRLRTFHPPYGGQGPNNRPSVNGNGAVSDQRRIHGRTRGYKWNLVKVREGKYKTEPGGSWKQRVCFCFPGAFKTYGNL
jgi:hypothetical protein